MVMNKFFKPANTLMNSKPTKRPNRQIYSFTYLYVQDKEKVG